ncbi:MAG TPA: phosphodiester glycosidase family protein [Candidatus Egerieenecus merdigallinarum]|nr:phosphodiester glycosidase family protein [Candidatus Egerieenecus merdigallinarum]
MGKTILRAVALVVMLALLALMVPTFTPLAVAEEFTEYPVYEPVTLPLTDAPTIDYQADTPYAPHADAYLPDETGYLDDSLSIRIEEFRAYDTTCLAAWIQVASPTQLRTELNKPYPSKSTAKASVIAKRVNAVLAINGDYFVYHNQGFIVRNGEVLREKFNEDYDTLIIDDKGDFTIIPSTTEEEIRAFTGNIVQAFTFGPGLVIDGVKTTEFPLKANTPNKETQRIAIAQMGPLSYLVVTTEGPENPGSTGLTLPEFAQVLYDLGAQNAYNLDGGSSSSLILNNKKINSLSTGKIRAVGDILYFISACPE